MNPAERAQVTLGLILAGLEHHGVVLRALPGGLLLTELPARPGRAAAALVAGAGDR